MDREKLMSNLDKVTNCETQYNQDDVNFVNSNNELIERKKTKTIINDGREILNG